MKVTTLTTRHSCCSGCCEEANSAIPMRAWEEAATTVMMMMMMMTMTMTTTTMMTVRQASSPVRQQQRSWTAHDEPRLVHHQAKRSLLQGRTLALTQPLRHHPALKPRLAPGQRLLQKQPRPTLQRREGCRLTRFVNAVPIA